MDQLLQEFSTSQPANVYAWLWQETAMSDLILRFTTELVVGQPVVVDQPASDAISAAPRSRNAALLLAFEKVHPWSIGHNPAAAGTATAACGAPSSIGGQVEKEGVHDHSATSSTGSPSGLSSGKSSANKAENTLNLHATVLTSNSAYFRARITSAVGASSVGSKRGRDMMLDETMEAGECEAAAAVLHFFYTSQLARQKDGSCDANFLLQMMKVTATM